jgi:hypothetical protein
MRVDFLLSVSPFKLSKEMSDFHEILHESYGVKAIPNLYFIIY